MPPLLTGGRVDLVVVLQSHPEVKGEPVAKKDDHHGVAHASAEALRAIPLYLKAPHKACNEWASFDRM